MATLDGNAARLVTGSIDNTSSISVNATGSDAQQALINHQNQSYNPFSNQTDDNSHQLQDLLAELRSLKNEVNAFHVTTQRLRDENDRLQQRLAKLELDGPTLDKGAVRVVELPRRSDSRNPFVLANGQITQPIDTQSTGSIGRVGGLDASDNEFDPFKPQGQPNIKITEQPLTMDFGANDTAVSQMMPKEKPATHVAEPAMASASSGGQRAESKVVPSPQAVRTSSQTSFGIDLGSFVSITDIRAAWREVSGQQKILVGDLRPLSRVSQQDDGRLALHLVLGPIPNAAQAASLCAQLNYANYDCSISAYRGQSLALN